MEQRGHAHSDWADSYRWQEVVADIAAVVTSLRLSPAIVVGHSAGAAWAYLYAATHPEHIERIVDVDSGAPYPIIVDNPPSPPVLESRQQFIDLMRALGLSEDVDADTRAWIEDGTMQLDNGRWTWRQDPQVWASFFRGELCAAPDEFMEQAGRVSCPVLIVRGAKSDFFPREKAERLAQAVPNATLIEVADAGHVVHLANPSGFFDAIARFLGLHA
jgi:pimeloyl-ACP methyl ester carboxylesterase